MPCSGSMPDATQPGNRWRPGLRHLAAPVLSAQDELQRDYETALAEIAALMAERARLSARLANADAEVSAAGGARCGAASDGVGLTAGRRKKRVRKCRLRNTSRRAVSAGATGLLASDPIR